MLIFVNTRNRVWNQLAYQFAHEFGHALTGHTNDWVTKPRGNHSNMWLEESLCELASLFSLRKMGQSWRVNPPYKNWGAYAERLWGYAERRLTDAANHIEDVKFADWLSANQESMRADPVIREKNTVVAAALLPLFEEQPSGWSTLGYLRSANRPPGETLEDHLARWRLEVPEQLAPFVDEVAALLGVA